MKLFKEKKYRKYFLVPFIFLGLIAATGSIDCGGGGSNGGDGGGGGPTGKLYVSGCTSNSILSYDNANSVSGAVLPNRTISGALTTLNNPGGIFGDTANDRLYMANYIGNSILVFNNASTASGNIAPNRTISGGSTTLNNPGGIFVDTTNNRLYVANYGGDSILLFSNASTADGNIAPNRTISGGSTTLNNPGGIFVDTTNNRLYVANYTGNSILVFNNASTASGEIAPSRTVNLPAGTGPGDVFVDITR
jgi:DNA-binding beta-propeller fold protein YncE